MQIHWNRYLSHLAGQAYLGLAAFLAAGCLSPLLNATITQVQLQASPASPQLLGTNIRLFAAAVDTNLGPLTYKWEVQGPLSSSYVLMRDFDVAATFNWNPNFVEGVYHL